eukprot:jgi/Chrzof1/9489/Cz04g05030.t1
MGGVCVIQRSKAVTQGDIAEPASKEMTLTAQTGGGLDAAVSLHCMLCGSKMLLASRLTQQWLFLIKTRSRVVMLMYSDGCIQG